MSLLSGQHCDKMGGRDGKAERLIFFLKPLFNLFVLSSSAAFHIFFFKKIYYAFRVLEAFRRSKFL
jgi:hypothetical protein